MIIVNLMGGVGNQMFQYALGSYLAVLSNQDLFLNTNIYDTRQSNRNFVSARPSAYFMNAF